MKIENTKARMHHVGPKITLAPGVNEVDAEEWAKVKDLPAVKGHIKAGDIVVVDEKKAK
jgi:SepF-like predicted cell division protein (DUF552 family)